MRCILPPEYEDNQSVFQTPVQTKQTFSLQTSSHNLHFSTDTRMKVGFGYRVEEEGSRTALIIIDEVSFASIGSLQGISVKNILIRIRLNLNNELERYLGNWLYTFLTRGRRIKIEVLYFGECMQLESGRNHDD